MAEQLSLFGPPEPKEAPKSAAPVAAPAQPESAPEPIAAYASVVLDIPSRLPTAFRSHSPTMLRSAPPF